MNFSETAAFRKDYKKLNKKYPSLAEDLTEFKKILREFPLGRGSNFTTLYDFPKLKIQKARFFCKYLKGSTLRVIYAYHAEANEIELIDFIELYSKGDKGRENFERIQDYIKKTNM